MVDSVPVHSSEVGTALNVTGHVQPANDEPAVLLFTSIQMLSPLFKPSQSTVQLEGSRRETMARQNKKRVVEGGTSRVRQVRVVCRAVHENRWQIRNGITK